MLSPRKGGVVAKRDKPQSEHVGTHHDAIDIEEIKRAVKALPGPPPGVEASELAMRSELRALRRSLAKRLAPLVVKGADDPAAKAILADYEKEREQLLKSKTSEVEKAMSARGESRSQGTEGQRKALEALATPGLPFTPISFALRPFLIWTYPTNMLTDSRSDSLGHSSAKISESRSGSLNENETLTFYYLWSNSSDYYAVVNAHCSTVLNGKCLANANTGIFDGGWVGVSCSATLSALEWWNQPPTYPPYQPEAMWNVFGLLADGGSFLSLDDLQLAFLSENAHDLHYVLFPIPPHSTAVFELIVAFHCYVDDGWVQIDFASQPNFSISSLLQLDLLTAPSMAVTAGFSPA
jgi:hypothetical protein